MCQCPESDPFLRLNPLVFHLSLAHGANFTSSQTLYSKGCSCLSEHSHHLFSLFSRAPKHHVWCFFCPQTLNQRIQTKDQRCSTLPLCEARGWEGWERSPTHTQSWAHMVGQEWATGSLQWPTALWDGQRLLNQRTNTSHFATITAILPSTSPNSPAAWMHFWPGRAQQVTAAMDLSPNTAWSMHPFTAKLCSEV